MRYLYFSLFFLLLGCSSNSQLAHEVPFQSGAKPHVVITQMEDKTHSIASSHAAESFTQFVRSRIAEKKQLQLTPEKEEFLVKMQLVNHSQLPQTPPELSMSVHLEILDMRTSSPHVILQEVLSYNTLLSQPLGEIDFFASDFRITPLGLAHAKLSREIATRIEDYVLLRAKGELL